MLTIFLTDLFETGNLKVDKDIKEFLQEDIEYALEILNKYFDIYRIQLPYNSSMKFCKEASLWASTYLYRLCQVLLLRELEEDGVLAHLPEYKGDKAVEELLSIDLVFRFIPQIFELSKKLSPSDILIDELKRLANEWSFSLYEIAEKFEVNLIEKNRILLEIYCNRLIERRFLKGVVTENVKEEITRQLGAYTNYYWKEFKELDYENKL